MITVCAIAPLFTVFLASRILYHIPRTIAVSRWHKIIIIGITAIHAGVAGVALLVAGGWDDICVIVVAPGRYIIGIVIDAAAGAMVAGIALGGASRMHHRSCYGMG